MNIQTAIDCVKYAGECNNIFIDTMHNTLKFKSDDVDIIDRDDEQTLFICLNENKTYYIDADSIKSIRIVEKKAVKH